MSTSDSGLGGSALEKDTANVSLVMGDNVDGASHSPLPETKEKADVFESEPAEESKLISQKEESLPQITIKPTNAYVEKVCDNDLQR